MLIIKMKRTLFSVGDLKVSPCRYCRISRSIVIGTLNNHTSLEQYALAT